MSYLTVNRGTPNRETPIDVLHPSGANIGGGANRTHWGKKSLLTNPTDLGVVPEIAYFCREIGKSPPKFKEPTDMQTNRTAKHTAPARRLAQVAAGVLAVGGVAALASTFLHGPGRAPATSSLGAEPPPEKGFRVCGNYCGDSWCNGQVVRESRCALLDNFVEPESCYDACCQHHDFCCIAGRDQRACNRGVVECVASCTEEAFRVGDFAHWLDCGVPLETAMVAIQDCECGLCPTPQAAVEELLDPGSAELKRKQYAGSRQRPGWVQLG